MVQVLCDDCVKTYKPYTYKQTLQRAIVSGVAEWQGVDDAGHITSRYSEYWTELGSTYKGQFYFNEYGYSSYINIKETILNLFPCVDDFRACHAKFNKERRNKIFANFLCFDCEKYLCAKCIIGHSEHFTFSEDDKNKMDEWDKIETKIIKAFISEGDTKEECIKKERAVLCNVVDLRDFFTVAYWEKFMSNEKENVFQLGKELNDISFVKLNPRIIYILNDNQTFLVTNLMSTRMKIYNIISYKLLGSIELPDIPAEITEIPSTDPSQTLIAVRFHFQGQIDIMNIQRRPADVISRINVQGLCYDLAYSNNKLITRCMNYLNGEERESIHVMDMAGEIINIIDLHNIPGIERGWLHECCMSVHSENETIYVRYPKGVICLSFTGQVLHTTVFTDLVPRRICVDRDQNVYVMDYWLPLYKLSSDLSDRVKIISEDAANVGEVTTVVHHKNKIYMVSMEGFVYIFSVD